MNEMKIGDEKKAVEEMHGLWTAHNISLGDGVFTIADRVVGDEVKLRRIVQIVSDVCDCPMSELRVLDLACLEGMYGIEFARQGARVCAIEGRNTNLEKARFAARALRLDNIEFHHDDVRHLSEAKYGRFDVVLCLGLLYHLTDPDVFTFLESIFAVCQRLAVIDTAVSLHPEQSFSYKGGTYLGRIGPEHAADATLEEKQRNLWASLDNPTSVYFTRLSLSRLLADVGFSSAYECHIPQEPEKPADRTTFVVIKGRAVSPICCPQLPPGYARELPEELTPAVLRRGLKLVSRSLPEGFRRSLKHILFSEKNTLN